MEKEIDKVEIKDEDTLEEDFSEEELANEETDWKAKAQELKGIAKRRATQLGKAKAKLSEIKDPEPKVEPEPQDKTKSSELDDGQLALLIAKGIDIDNEAELELVKEYMTGTDKPLKDIVSNKFFQNDLKELKEAKEAKDALPSSSKRSAGSARDKVDYWIKKGEMPPYDQPELREAYVNAKLKTKTDGNPFTDNPHAKVN